jgi:hypothetical protein
MISLRWTQSNSETFFMQDQPSTDEWAEEPIRQLSREEYERLRDAAIGKRREAAKAQAASSRTEQQTQPLAGPDPPANPIGEHQSAPGQFTQAAAPHEEGRWEDRTKEVPRPHSEARAGLATLYGLFPGPVVFLPIPGGRKEPILVDWQQINFERTQAEDYQEMLLTGWGGTNIGVSLGLKSGRLFTVNINDQGAVEELVRDFSWLEDTTKSWAQRGCQFWLLLEEGDYPKADIVLLKRKGKVVGELRLGGDKGNQSVIHGVHKCGVRYQHNGKVPKEVGLVDLDDLMHWGGYQSKAEQEAQVQSEAEQKLREKYQLLRPKKLTEASRKLPPELISGILYQSRRMLLTGASKSRKSWMLHQMAYSIANGIKLLDRFPTTRSPVLYVNFELLEAGSALRFDAMQRELGGNQDNIIVISVSDYLDVLGDNFSQYLALCARDFGRKAVILDPMWRILGSYDENKNSEVRLALAPLVRFAREAQASMIGAHHHAKGSPIGKEAIDRSSGAGAWHRDPAVIKTMTPHRSPECFTINIVTSDFAPVEPFVVRFVHPLFVIDENLDPTELRAPPRPKEEEKKDENTEKMLAVLRGADREGGLTFTEWYNAAGISRATFARKLDALIRTGGPVYKSRENDKYQLSPRYAADWSTKMEEDDINHE